jgi:Zn finger protein HypA/HybF involved in hydrogenase expression
VSPVQASCPACSAPVTFNVANSIVAICEYCNSALARGDRNLEDLGKVADLTDTDSPLDLGLKGTYQNVGFELTGRAQVKHQAGGMWDEWYAAFDDGRWGWIAEAQGKFYVTFQTPLLNPGALPSYNQLVVGQNVNLPDVARLMVAEKGIATAFSAKGEIPYKFIPNRQYEYADLSGAQAIFATIDYGDLTPSVYVGKEVPLKDLGFPPGILKEHELRQVKALALDCPQCRGPLSIQAPDKSERMTCPNCGSFLDINQGKLRYLDLPKLQPLKPLIPLGAEGEFEGKKMKMLGFLERSVWAEGVRYPWQEYLIYHPDAGFHWLVVNKNHWNYVKPLPPGSVQVNALIGQATFADKTFKIFDYGKAVVDYVSGEFYWKVTVGELVDATDYIAPPLMLSSEQTPSEISWSLGAYIQREQIEKAFNLPQGTLAEPYDVGATQPYTGVGNEILTYWGIFTLITLVLWVFFAITSTNRVVLSKSYLLPKLANPTDSTQIIFTDPFELGGRKNLYIVARSPVNNSWFYFEGDLINEETGLVQSFSIPIEYYSGVDDGESWSEGSQESTMFISSLPAGKYTLRLESQWSSWQQDADLSLEIRQGIARTWHPIFVLFLLILIPIYALIKKSRFESKRWADSPFNLNNTSGNNDDSSG